MVQWQDCRSAVAAAAPPGTDGATRLYLSKTVLERTGRYVVGPLGRSVPRGAETCS